MPEKDEHEVADGPEVSLRVVRGAPDERELAALVTVLAARLSGPGPGEPGRAPARPVAAALWSHDERDGHPGEYRAPTSWAVRRR